MQMSDEKPWRKKYDLLFSVLLAKLTVPEPSTSLMSDGSSL